MSTTGSSDDIRQRVRQLIPRRWFQFAAPIRDAILGGLSDGAAAGYNFYLYAKQQSRIATSTGPFLDLIAYDFLARNLLRGSLNDNAFRTLIKATILQERVTRAGMVQAVTTITGNAPQIFEPWNTGDVFALGHGALGVSRLGSMNLPTTVFMIVKRGSPSGIPTIAGIGSNFAGIGCGYLAVTGPQNEPVGITDADIYQVINLTRPTGTEVWVQFS